MVQLIAIVIILILVKLLYDVYKDQILKTSKSRPSSKNGSVIDLSNAWIDLESMPYTQRDHLLDSQELNIYNMLTNILPSKSYIVLPRVRLADFITVPPQASNRAEYINQISQRSIDILICESEELRPVAIINLENDTGGKKKQLANRFTRKVIDAAKLPFLDLKTSSPPSETELANRLRQLGLSF
ncbi:MAG: DUF2726 domain-containing protein [Syntrophomonadaceae bacterium]